MLFTRYRADSRTSKAISSIGTLWVIPSRIFYYRFQVGVDIMLVSIILSPRKLADL